MSALSGVIWCSRTLPWLSGSNYDRDKSGKRGWRNYEGRFQGGDLGFAKVQVHYFFCLTWLADENIIIIKKPAEHYITGH